MNLADIRADPAYEALLNAERAVALAREQAEVWKAERNRYRQALEEIAREDYRGNRPWSATRAQQALSEPS